MPLRPFNEVYPRIRWDKEELDYGIRGTRHNVAELSSDIIEAEGPISEERLYQLIGAHFGLSRVSSSRQSEILMMVSYQPEKTEFAGKFYWPRKYTSATYSDYRIRGKGCSAPTRKLQNIHPKELINCAVAVLDKSEALLEDDLMRETLRIVGQTKLTAAARQYLSETFSWGVKRGYLTLEKAGPNSFYRIG